MFHDDSKYKCRQVLVSAAILLHLLFTIILARQRVDQNTEDWENQELVISNLSAKDIISRHTSKPERGLFML